MRRCRIESENENDIDENENNNNINNNEWLDIIKTKSYVIPFVRSGIEKQVVSNEMQDFYFLFVSQEIFQMIVDKINRYAI